MTPDLQALIELLPCPFCGESSAYLWTPSGTDRDVAIRCNGCGLMTRTFKSDPVNFSGNEAAITAWNTRQTAPTLPGAGGGDAEFEVHAGGEYFATTCGPRADALRDAMHYVSTLIPDDGVPEVFEVTRTIALPPQQGG